MAKVVTAIAPESKQDKSPESSESTSSWYIFSDNDENHSESQTPVPREFAQPAKRFDVSCTPISESQYNTDHDNVSIGVLDDGTIPKAAKAAKKPKLGGRSQAENPKPSDNKHKTKRRQHPSWLRVTAAGTERRLIIDGHDQSFWKKVVETTLIVGALTKAIDSNWNAIAQQEVEVATWIGCLFTVLLIRWEFWNIPQALYLYFFPPLVSLASNPDTLPINLALTLCVLPLPGALNQILVTYMLPSKPELYFLYWSFYDLSTSLTTTSLTPIETSLLAVLLCNLTLNAKSPEMIFLKFILLGSIFCLAPCTIFIKKTMRLSSIPCHRRPKDWQIKQLSYTFLILAIYATGMIFFVLPLAAYSMEENPIYYISSQLFSPSNNSKVRWMMMAYWGTLLMAVIPTVDKYAANWQVDRRRKIWHGLITTMFLLVGINIDGEFVQLAMTGAVCIFLFLEFIRAVTLYPLGQWLHVKLHKYTDERDSCGPIIVSHIFLLIGISIPIFLARSSTGIVCLGLGDAAASIIGRKYGRHRWFDSKKTIEGTLAFVLASILGLSLLKATKQLPGLDWLGVVSSAIATATLEATSGMNDNVIVPVYMFVCCAINSHTK